MKLKLIPKSTLIQPRIFEGSNYVHPWYKENGCVRRSDKAEPIHVEFYGKDNLELYKPNPPSKEAVERAKFKDKTYHWKRDDNIRPRNKRVIK